MFVSASGEIFEVLCCDYGWRTGPQRVRDGAAPALPPSAWTLARLNFAQEWAALRRSFRLDDYSRIARRNPPRGPIGRALYAAGEGVVRAFSALDERLEASGVFRRLLPDDPVARAALADPTSGLSAECREVREKLKRLTLDNAAVWRREKAMEAAGQGVETPWFVRGVYLALCVFLDVAFDRRPIQRFWFLETVARMPYFSYITCLHLLETFGWWRAGVELRKVHLAEELNELHHLQIMESLGGDALWVDRFVAQHAAIVYYWILTLLFFASPRLAYNFSELIETHAVATYAEFADANAELLASLPPPLVAAEYYNGGASGDLYFFDLIQTSRRDGPDAAPRRPPVRSLLDVFRNIADDEAEHVATMAACQDATIGADLEAIRERAAAGRMAPPATTTATAAAAAGGRVIPPRLQGRGAEPTAR